MKLSITADYDTAYFTAVALWNEADRLAVLNKQGYEGQNRRLEERRVMLEAMANQFAAAVFEFPESQIEHPAHCFNCGKSIKATDTASHPLCRKCME